MFDKLRKIFVGIAGSSTETVFGPGDIRLAEAALLFHVIAADGKVLDRERERMEAILKRDFDLGEAELAALMEAANQAENEAVDLYRFTSLITRQFDREQRIAVVEKLWEVVFADGELHELEDNVVWRIADLLHVETRDRIELKQRVRDRQGG